MDKNTARRKGLAARAALTEKQREEKNAVLYEKAMKLAENCSCIGCYVSMKDEADTHRLINALIKAGKTVAVPRVTGSTLRFYKIHSLQDLQEGTFHVMEPAEINPCMPEETDLMFVPLSAFDSRGNRTGYGRGYYDSVLAQCRYKAGLAYAEQEMDAIEADPWDIPLDEIICA